MKKILLSLIIVAIAGLMPISTYSQCKGFTKTNCLPKLEPYVYNGQLNSAVLNEGDIAELLLTFYGGQSYRIFVCYQEMLGKVEFKLLDTERNVVFNNKDMDNVDFWDFTANSTQQLIVQIKVPESNKKGEFVQSGCVSILVGFKDK